MQIVALGDAAWLIKVADSVGPVTLVEVQRVTAGLRRARLPGGEEIVSAFVSVAVFGREDVVMADLRAAIEEVLAELPAAEDVEGRTWELPVNYGGQEGPDLREVAERLGLTPEEVVRRHTAPMYRVHAVGFAPGFPYLAGLDPSLHLPRRAVPRTRVPAGSVAVGAAQTGVYPVAGPGGWHLLGRTGEPLFDPARRPPARLQVGDQVRFRAVAVGAYEEAMSTARPEPVGGDQGPMGLEIITPGPLTTVQDGGRRGWRDQGVALGGAADRWALSLANVAVGNSPEAAGLEWTWHGPRVRWHRDAWVVVSGCGAVGLPCGQPWRVRAGDFLDLREPAQPGARGYLAVRGGLEVPRVLGSAATDLRAGWGGVAGRALRTGDGLNWADIAGEPRMGWSVSHDLLTTLPEGEVTLRVLRGAQANEFGAEGWRRFTGQVYGVGPDSDRMGVRLKGPVIKRESGRELLSAPVCPGAVQVPAGGQAIVLLADAQTLGGYPLLAHVISADWSRLAQLKPGDQVRFVEVTLAQAEAARQARGRELAWLRTGCRMAWGHR